MSTCRPDEREGLIEALDREFVLGKGRTLSLRERYPRLLAPENVENVVVARLEGRVVAAAASKPFAFVDGAHRWPAAAVGAVWTDEAFRRRGLASRVMRSMRQAHADRGAKLLVLWTSLHAFYRSLGWVLDDAGVAGRCSGAGVGGASDVQPTRLAPEDFPELEALRREHLETYVERLPVDWTAIPIPATSVELYRAPDAYALVGSEGQGKGYLYELVGDERGFPPIWGSIRRRYADLVVNGQGARANEWLARNGVTLLPQRLAMTMPLTSDAGSLPGRLVVPYLDRV